MTLYIIACLVLILFVLLQPGKSDAAAVFGGGANSSAFGPRGTATVEDSYALCCLCAKHLSDA